MVGVPPPSAWRAVKYEKAAAKRERLVRRSEKTGNGPDQGNSCNLDFGLFEQPLPVPLPSQRRIPRERSSFQAVVEPSPVSVVALQPPPPHIFRPIRLHRPRRVAVTWGVTGAAQHNKSSGPRKRRGERFLLTWPVV